MTRAAEPHASSDLFDGQGGLSEQELARRRYTLFSHVCVRRYTESLSECSLEMPRTHTGKFRKHLQGDRVCEVIVNVIRHDPEAVPREAATRSFRRRTAS